jgi:hypothetical protein
MPWLEARGSMEIVETGSSMGAGAIISLGRKIRALTASMATAKMSTISRGAM